MVKSVNLSPEEISAIIENPVEKRLTLAILQIFIDNDLTYSTRTQWKPADSIEPDDYRVFCYIKKSKEALIINTKYTDSNAYCLQVRILNGTNFERLDTYTENIRNQILNAQKSCNNCVNCGKEYDFIYKGKQYRKCHMICNNFWLSNFNSDDIDSVIDIIRREIELGKPKRRN